MAEQELQCVYDPLIELIERFENVKAVSNSTNPFEGLTIEEILQKHIVSGLKKNLEANLEVALKSYSPLSIINDILLAGMKTVGELFGSGKMQLPFVLQSAETMKAAVRYLEPLMEKTDSSTKGSILLATVEGDVHDIGKNLVDIILSNNGFRVVNIGIKQSINSILEGAEKGECEVIGMSGLLVKSTLIMRDNLLEMNRRGLSHIPVILGGAALTRAYVEQDLRSIYNGKVFYAQDAFEGLAVMQDLAQELPETPKGDIKVERIASHRVGVIDEDLYQFDGTQSDVATAESIPRLPFYGFKKRTKFDLYELYKFINKVALFRGQWQYKRATDMGNSEFAEWLEKEATPILERFQRELSAVVQPKVMWGYFPCGSEGNDLIVYAETSLEERCRFQFPRQRDGRRLCLSDFFRPAAQIKTLADADTVGFQIVTVGDEVSRYERRLFEAGEFKDYFYVHGFGVELTEALAEYWHVQMRHELGIGGNDPAEKRLLFSAKYQGARYSFGYPACPNLEDQTKIFELMKPEEIGITLTSEFMLSPEQSTSAIVVHHPEAKYFNIR